MEYQPIPQSRPNVRCTAHGPFFTKIRYLRTINFIFSSNLRTKSMNYQFYFFQQFTYQEHESSYKQLLVTAEGEERRGSLLQQLCLPSEEAYLLNCRWVTERNGFRDRQESEMMSSYQRPILGDLRIHHGPLSYIREVDWNKNEWKFESARVCNSW